MNATTDDLAPKYDPYPIDLFSLLRLFIVGFLTGLVGWLLYLGIAQYFIEPVFCQNASTFSMCKNGGTIAWVSASIIVLAAATAVLARMAVYRPLLIVLGVIFALWSANAWLGGMSWYLGALWQALLFGLGFAVFGWIARTLNFVVAVIVSILVIVLARLILVSV